MESWESIKQTIRSVEVQSAKKSSPLAATLVFKGASLPRLALGRSIKRSTSASPYIEWARSVRESGKWIVVCIIMPTAWLEQFIKIDVVSKFVAYRMRYRH